MRLVAVTPSASGGLSLRGLVNVATAALALLVVVGVVVGLLALQSLSRARTDLYEQLGPAQVASGHLLAATFDVQNQLRRQLIFGPDGPAVDVSNELELVGSYERELRTLLEGRDDLLARLDASTEARRTWERTNLAAATRTMTAGAMPTDADMRDGARSFEQVRVELEALDGQLESQGDAARDALASAAQRLTASLVLAAALLVVGIAGVWVGLRRMVLAPLSRTVEDARTVADGQFDHVVGLGGPAELAEVADALERVRRELVQQLREAEEREADLARSNAELEQFAYVASHDLQEPLRKVSSFCQLLKLRYEGELDDKADTYIEFAVDGATRMQALINDLLEFSRVGRSTDHFTDVDLSEVIDRSLGDLKEVIAATGATVEVRGRPGVVAGDRSLLSSLFQNLVGNALKFRSAEPPHVVIDTSTSDGEVEVTVSDNGIGIPDEYRDQVFGIFQRLHSRSEYDGTGIGLALCRKIVEFHGGRITLEAGDDGGTRCRFTLARHPSPPPVDRTPEQAGQWGVASAAPTHAHAR